MEDIRVYKFFDLTNIKKEKYYFVKANSKEEMIENVCKHFEKQKNNIIHFSFEIHKLSSKDIDNLSKYFLKYDSSSKRFFKFLKKGEIIIIKKYNFFTKFLIKKNFREIAISKKDENTYCIDKKLLRDFKNSEKGEFKKEITIN